MEIQKTLEAIEEKLKKVALPWYGTSNYPFYVDVRKPRESLSKHDYKRPTYWHQDDGEYLFYCVNVMPDILKYVRKLEDELKELKKPEVVWKDCAVHGCSSQTCAIAGRSCNSWQ